MTYIPSLLAAPTDVQEPAPPVGVHVAHFACQQPDQTSDRFRQLSIVVVEAGSFCYDDHGYTRLLEPGAVVLGCAGDAYGCSHPYGGGDRGTIFQFSDAALAQLQVDLGSRARPRPAVFAQAPGLAARAAVALARQAVSPEEGAYGLAAGVLGALDGSATEVPPSLRPADRDRAHAAAQLIEERFAEALDLHALAAAVATSPFHFLRCFRQELGLTPHQYLLRTRLRHAVRLLATTDRPITEIALAVGFNDLANFIRTFRAHVGEPPSTYRRRLA
jgi:AraC-like DNA-binding protein